MVSLITSSSPSSTDPNEPASQQQQLLDRLVDSLEAMEEVQNLTRDLGAFVLKSRVKASQKKRGSSRASDSMERPLKRKRIPEDSSKSSSASSSSTSSSSDLHPTVSEPSVRRMLMLYEHLQMTHALFQNEISKSIDEKEKEVSREQKSHVAKPISAE